MPVLGAGEAKNSITVAFDCLGLDVEDLDGVVAVRGRAPTHQTIALYSEQKKKHMSHSKSELTQVSLT